ncbi:MAG: beta-propeller fold lactonase family protein [Chloroflexota bacterium]
MPRTIALPSARYGIVAALALVLALFAAGFGTASAHGRAGVVYTLTNAAGGNEVAIFDRANDGTLTADGTVATGGLGTGAGLGSQGAIALDGNRLLAVNAGSDSISLFSVHNGNLTLEDVEASGGDMPISVTVHDNIAYVLNAGAPENITGFRIHNHGLTQIAGSARPLSGSGVGPAEVRFSPNGRLLVVTEKGTNKIDTYFVGFQGLGFGPVVHDSVGQTPFGFDFGKRGTLIVSEAFGGAPDASALSSYDVSWFGSLTPVTSSAPTTETAACWVAVSNDGRFAYATNTGSGTVTGYRVAHDGTLTILNADGVTGQTPAGSKPIDAAFSNGRYLYVLSAGTNTITAFEQHADGSLANLGSVTGLPGGTVGLAAR